MAAPRTEDDVLAELGTLSSTIGEHDRALKDAYERRLVVYAEARAMDPAITFGRIAEAAGVTEVAVIQALRKRDEKDAKAVEAARSGA